MNSNFDQAFNDLLGSEGGYVNNPHDPGGETNWGITIAVARENGYTAPMRAMSKDTAKQIYSTKYWKPEFDALPYPVAFQIFDASVNSGQSRAIKWLQAAVNVDQDGVYGPITAAAVKGIDPLKFVLMFNASRLDFYTNLSTWGTFGKGWARRIVANLKKGAS